MKTFQEFILESHCNGSPKGMDCPTHGSVKCPKVKPHKTVEAIAKKHRMDVSNIQNQLKMGIPIEYEHTKNKTLATDIALQHLDEFPDYYTRLKKMEASARKEHKKFKDVKEENLHRWYQDSVSKKGKLGWVDVVDGDACAREEGETATPKCVSSEKRASMSKEERLAAQAAKRREDPNQPQKSGASRPTMVTTDRKTRKEEMDLQEVKDKPGKGSGKKDACYSKVKSRYDVWPSAYASGALVKCRKVGAKNWGNKSKNEDVKEGYTRIQSRGSTYSIVLNWRGKYLSVQMFFPQFSRPPKDQVTYEVRKIYPGAIVLSYNPSIKDPTKPLLFTGVGNESK